MATRVNPTEVKQIMDISSSIIDDDVQIFIDLANLMVNKVITDTSITAAHEKQIEKWLSAHYVAIRDPQSKMEKAGSVSQSFQEKVDLGLNQTRWGQNVLNIDTSGAFAALQSQADGEGVAIASVAALGPVSDEDADIIR